MNKVILLGRLTRDPEVRFTQSAEPMAICRFTLAVDRSTVKDGERKADFINCISFGNKGETIGQYFHKGNKIAVTGRLQVSEYTDQSHNRRYSTDVVVDEFDFCESKNDSSAGSYSVFSGFDTVASQPDGFNGDDIADDDLPF